MQKKAIIIVIALSALIVIGTGIYWFQYGSKTINRECDEIAKTVDSNPYQENYKKVYEGCLESKGLK